MSEPTTETTQKPTDEQTQPSSSSSTDKPLEDNASSKDQQQQSSAQQQQPTRKRTRATAEQLAVLEDTFAVNVSPNSKLRKQLAEQLKMSERSIQIWFQNRRAKVKHMQKRAQIQMQQASIRAQLYHYHQQHYGSHPYGGPPLMPLPQHHTGAPPPHPYYRPYPVATARMPAVSRAQSVDAINHQRASSAPTVSVPPSTNTTHPLHITNMTPPPSHIHSSWQTSSTPPHSSPPSTSSSHLSLSQSIAAEPAMPALVSVPDAGPTAMLASSSSSQPQPPPTTATSQPSAQELGYAPSTPAATPPSALIHTATIAPNDLWCSPDDVVDNLGRAQSVSLAVSDPFVACSRALSDPIVTTIDPSNLMMTPPTSASSSTSTSSSSDSHSNNSFSEACLAAAAPTAAPPPASSEQQQQQQTTESANSTQLNATTLTIGSWHRMKLRTDDLVCEYLADRRQFCWHIADNGCRFRMEIALDAVASIEYIASDCDVLADVHFDMSEPPFFYMEKNQEWIQCSDFTEGKQASRFFRHTLKGIAHHMKQELLTMSSKHEETRRLLRFMETPAPPPYPEPFMLAAAAAAAAAPPPPLPPHQFYWGAAIPPPPPPSMMPFVNEPACGYLS